MDKNTLTVTIAGASGVVGRHIIRHAQNQGWKIRILSRKLPENEKNGKTKDIAYYVWNPEKKPETGDDIVLALEGADFLINLAGSSIAAGRLGKKMQGKVLYSRLNATNALIDACQKCKHPPAVWGQASAVGFYGDTDEKTITENSSPGDFFLSDVCVQWEKAARRITEIIPAVRLVTGRFGLVLAKDAPAWQKMVTPVRLGIGGALGSGNQWYSWIDADDLAGAFFHLFHQKDASGVYNFTSPDSVRQKDLAQKIAEFYHKPHFMKIPKFMLRWIMGKTADELLLASCKALPDKLIKAGYRFVYSDINDEINHLLK
jgi:hypothetical protein